MLRLMHGGFRLVRISNERCISCPHSIIAEVYRIRNDSDRTKLSFTKEGPRCGQGVQLRGKSLISSFLLFS